MHIFYSLEDWAAYRSNYVCHPRAGGEPSCEQGDDVALGMVSRLRGNDKRGGNDGAMVNIGFVPTMGNLHRGHISLIEAARKDCDIVVASIFVNPTQFNNTADFTHYPRTLEADFEQLRLAGVDAVLVPNYDEIYADNYRYQVHETVMSADLEGQHRPGHYNGVLTVVMKLLNIVKPTHAYFGEKDYQQCRLIQDMCDAFFMDINIHMCPTVREASGLAMSSRNNRLTPAQKEQAEAFAACFQQQNKSCDVIQHEIEAMGLKVDYVAEKEGRRFAAVYVGDVRLIDTY